MPDPAPPDPSLVPVSLPDTPISLDTGNQTPVIFNANKEVSASLQQSFQNGSILLPGTTANVTAHAQTPTADLSLFQLTAGTAEGVNKIDVGAAKSGFLSCNLGIPLFEQYDVAFNLTTGVLGLRPLPAPTPVSVSLSVHIDGRKERTTSRNWVMLSGKAAGTGLA